MLFILSFLIGLSATGFGIAGIACLVLGNMIYWLFVTSVVLTGVSALITLGSALFNLGAGERGVAAFNIFSGLIYLGMMIAILVLWFI